MSEALVLRTAGAAPSRRAGLALVALSGAAVISIALYLSLDLRGDLMFALSLRLTRLAALVQVAAAIAIATVVFQTVTGNRILTPSIMGLDSLYVLVQSVMVFALGGVGYAALPNGVRFAGETLAMGSLAVALFLPLLTRAGDLVLTLLAGVVLGVLFRSLSNLVARLIDPNDFAVVQSATHADFNTINGSLVLPCVAATLAGAAVAWRARHTLDVMTLGRDTAVGLGVDWPRVALGLLLVTAGLVAVSTALVGPVALFGLLVVALAERLVGTLRHALLLPAATLTAVVLLVGGQTVLAHGFANAVPLGVVVEFAGGLVFLALVVTRAR